MRGKEVYEDMRVVPYGITPAYAGKSALEKAGYFAG